MLSIAKTFEFAASHRLCRDDWPEEKNKETFGKCHAVHGHNYRLEVLVSGSINPSTGMVIDASCIEAVVKQHVFNQLDHKHLNSDVPWLSGKIPTLEVLVEGIWQQLVAPFERQDVMLKRLVLWETSRIYVIREAD